MEMKVSIPLRVIAGGNTTEEEMKAKHIKEFQDLDRELAFTLAYARTELIRAWAQIEMLHNASPADPATQARTARKDEVSARIADVLGKYADATKLREREGATNGQA